MSIGEGLYAYLSAYAGLISLVSTRIYPVTIPQGAAMPGVSIQLIDVQPVRTGTTDAGLESALYQVNSWATTYAGAKAVAAQVKAALRDYGGAMGSVTAQRVFYEGERDQYNETPERYGVSQDFTIWHEG